MFKRFRSVSSPDEKNTTMNNISNYVYQQQYIATATATGSGDECADEEMMSNSTQTSPSHSRHKLLSSPSSTTTAATAEMSETDLLLLHSQDSHENFRVLDAEDNDNDDDDDDVAKVHHSRLGPCNLPFRPCCRRRRKRRLFSFCGNPTFQVLLSAIVWFGMGVLAICTTKLLLSSHKAPALLLTLQQLTLSSFLLRVVLRIRDGGARPLPWKAVNVGPNEASSTLSMLSRTPYREFILAGLCNSLDFLFSNNAFGGAAPSFVETIKSSDPITTTAVALMFGMDQIRNKTESLALFILCLGVFLSTLGNQTSSSDNDAQVVVVTFRDSAMSASTVLAANLCFAFRALNQKRYQQSCTSSSNNEVSSPSSPPAMDDVNLLCRMQQMGAMALFPVAMMFYSSTIWAAIFETSRETQLTYGKLAVTNAVAFVSYNLAACMVLSQVSMVTYSGLNCVRRMFCVLSTCIFFGVPISPIGALGIAACFTGFGLFTHQRRQRPKVKSSAATSSASPSFSRTTPVGGKAASLPLSTPRKQVQGHAM